MFIMVKRYRKRVKCTHQICDKPTQRTVQHQQFIRLKREREKKKITFAIPIASITDKTQTKVYAWHPRKNNSRYFWPRFISDPPRYFWPTAFMTNLTTELSIEWNTRRRRWALRNLVSVSISSLSSSESIEAGRRIGQTLTLRRLSLVTGEKSSVKYIINVYHLLHLASSLAYISSLLTLWKKGYAFPFHHIGNDLCNSICQGVGVGKNRERSQRRFGTLGLFREEMCLLCDDVGHWRKHINVWTEYRRHWGIV